MNSDIADVLQIQLGRGFSLQRAAGTKVHTETPGGNQS